MSGSEGHQLRDREAHEVDKIAIDLVDNERQFLRIILLGKIVNNQLHAVVDDALYTLSREAIHVLAVGCPRMLDSNVGDSLQSSLGLDGI